jgi:hypothetical protein
VKKKSLLDEIKATEAPDSRPESCERIEKAEDCSLTYYGAEIKTVEALLKHANIDLTLWVVESQTINNWEVAGRRKMGGTGASRNADTLWKTGLRQIKVKLRRLAPKPIQDGIMALLADVKPIATAKPPRAKKADPHLFEASIWDHHFGKYAHAPATGTNYSLDIAEREYRLAIDAMIVRAGAFSVDRVVLPIGGDFLHTDNDRSETTKGTRVESTDDRMSKVFRVAGKSLQYAVERLLEVAPVDVVWVPGNHDASTSFYLTEWLSALFRANKNVQVDNGPRNRKYYPYGANLLGYTHGDKGKHSDYPTVMATEVPQLWAESRYRSWRVGHFHTRRETRHTAGDSFHGTEVRVLGSLCGTDSWHYENGFVGQPRTAECHLFSKSSGPVGHFIIHGSEPNVPPVQLNR